MLIVTSQSLVLMMPMAIFAIREYNTHGSMENANIVEYHKKLFSEIKSVKKI